jgi:phage terminase small subunit
MALTEQKRRYAEARLSGQTKKKAAISAGCPEKTASQAASRLERDGEVLAAMGRATVVKAAAKATQPQGNPDPYIPKPADDPLIFFKAMMNDLEADPKLRLEAAKSLAAFTVLKPTESGKKDQKADAAKNAGAGRYGTGAPPLRAVK